MPSFSFIHTADLHLDSPFSVLSQDNPELASSLRSATFEAFDKIVNLCLEKQVDFLLVAGDVYDGSERSLRAQVRFRDGLKRLDKAGIRSFVVHGNHDPLNAWSSTLDWPSGVHIFGDKVETVDVRKDGTTIASVQGVSFTKRDERRNLAKLFKRTGPSFYIGLLHANVGSDTGHEPYAPCSMEDLLRPEMDYWALGHVHRNKVLSEQSPFVIYPGTPQGRNIKETGEKGCYFVRVEENREVAFEYISTDVIRWVRKEIPIYGLESEQALLNSLEEACRKISDSESGGLPSIVRIFLTGSGPLYEILRRPQTVPDLLDLIHEIGMSCLPYVWVEDIRLDVNPALDVAARMKEGDFLGELLNYSQELSQDKGFNDWIGKELSPLFDDSRVRRFIDMPNKDKLLELIKKAEEICWEGLQVEEES